jgi:hypothetical protein
MENAGGMVETDRPTGYTGSVSSASFAVMTIGETTEGGRNVPRLPKGASAASLL